MHESNLISVIESIKTDNTEIQDLITNLVNQYYEDSDNLLDEVEIYKF